MAEIELVIAIVLVFAAVLVAIGILVSIIRLFTTNTTAAPPGVLFLIAGLLSLFPPYAVSYLLRMTKGTLTGPTPTEGGVSGVAEMFMTLAPFALLATVVIAGVLLAFALVPFSARSGRKASPLIGLMLVEILLAVLIGVFFWEARTSITERDRDRDPRPMAEYESEPPDANSFENYVNSFSNSAEDTSDPDTDTNTTSRSKTISGGVVNGKAIDLQQPAYPPAARAVRAKGAVSVQVLVDEKGEVVSATAVSGHPLLRAAAVQAARKARFTPTKLSGVPVKVSGVLTFNFSVE
jgi:TonB family protein